MHWREKLMATGYPPLTQDQIKELFIQVPPPDPNTFEFALVLGGTVSAGAYTAGAVDFLIEALDCWTRLRDKGDGSAPRHKVLLKVITGTSGGGVNAAIAARALAYDFPHVVRSTAHPERDTGNPFYETWIKRLTLNGFLGTSDIDQGTLGSVLNGSPIDDGAAYLTEFAQGEPIQRSYLGDPLGGHPDTD
jgi:predicted acylesterase/phospholipase RssA